MPESVVWTWRRGSSRPSPGGGAGGAAEGVAGTEAGLIALGGIAFDAAGDLFIVETGRNRAFHGPRVSRGADGLVTGTADEVIVTVAGAGIQGFSATAAPALSAQFSAPSDLAFDLPGGPVLLVADSSNHRIRRVAAGGNGLIDGAADEVITTVAGGGGAAGDEVLATTIALNLPRGVTADRFGNIFISEAGALKVHPRRCADWDHLDHRRRQCARRRHPCGHGADVQSTRARHGCRG